MLYDYYQQCKKLCGAKTTIVSTVLNPRDTVYMHCMEPFYEDHLEDVDFKLNCYSKYLVTVLE